MCMAGKGGATGAMSTSPSPPTPTLPYMVLYISEHFANFVCDLLVNIAPIGEYCLYYGLIQNHNKKSHDTVSLLLG